MALSGFMGPRKPQDSQGQYSDDITNSTSLSRERECELSARIQSGDLAARNELVEANLRFVVVVAKGYQNRGLPLLELIAAGNEGLITAAERFDGARGFKFISYAVWWIKQAILQAIGNHTRTVRLPFSWYTRFNAITTAGHQLSQKLKRKVTLTEIAEELGVTVEEVEDTLRTGQPESSLDNQLEDDDDCTLMDLLPDPGPPPDAGVLAADFKADLEAALALLDEREREIVRLYFGLDSEGSMTLEEIGTRMNLTRERVRQLKERALDKLRQPSRAILIQRHAD